MRTSTCSVAPMSSWPTLLLASRACPPSAPVPLLLRRDRREHDRGRWRAGTRSSSELLWPLVTVVECRLCQRLSLTGSVIVGIRTRRGGRLWRQQVKLARGSPVAIGYQNESQDLI
ncbi:hypothetical protein BDZ91DRAFT_747526 [Kalaharituber pfeilii]|nr:hypothetical protein BDZ91DRAFT_747526 [Kalaharituber pfeilii]